MQNTEAQTQLFEGRTMRSRAVNYCLTMLLFGLAISIGFVSGARKASAVPVPCVTCTCEQVYAWWVSSLGCKGRSARRPGTATPVDYAILNIKAAGACQAGGLANNGTGDLWDHP